MRDLEQKISQLESQIDHLETEFSHLNELLMRVGFEEGILTLKQAAEEILQENV